MPPYPGRGTPVGMDGDSGAGSGRSSELLGVVVAKSQPLEKRNVGVPVDVEDRRREPGPELTLIRHLAVARKHVVEALLRDEDILVDLVDPLGPLVLADGNVLDGGDAPGLRREV